MDFVEEVRVQCLKILKRNNNLNIVTNFSFCVLKKIKKKNEMFIMINIYRNRAQIKWKRFLWLTFYKKIQCRRCGSKQ